MGKLTTLIHNYEQCDHSNYVLKLKGIWLLFLKTKKIKENKKNI